MTFEEWAAMPEDEPGHRTHHPDELQNRVVDRTSPSDVPTKRT